MRVRPAAAADAARVAEIYAHYVEHSLATFDEVAPDVAAMARKIDELQAAGFPFLVAVDGADAVLGYGYAGAYRPRAAYRFTAEDSVYVDPAARRRGAGRALLEAVLAACAARGAREVVAVIAATEDPGSLALHRALGFREVGRLERVGFKHERWVDTVFLQRSL